MQLSRLIIREISHRKLNFVLSVVAVAVAAIAVVVADGVVRRDALVTERLLSVKQSEAEAAIEAKVEQVAVAGAELEDAIRKQMLGLGFNVLILPESQDPAELHLRGSLSETMPEEYATRLSESKIMTINHLLPTVMKQVEWPEQEIDVVLYGTRGEVPIMHRGLKKPMLDAVAPGQMVLGYEVARRCELEPGDEVEFMGETFRISKTHPERGSTDDVTVWIDLGKAQELLGLQNLVHAILALECECAGDRIAQIRAEISGVLPGTQVIERYSQALARFEARTKAKEVAEESLAAERAAGEAWLAREAESRASLEGQHRRVAQWLIPTVLLLAAAAVGLLAYVNVRYRREEIGILRAIGMRTRQILAVFLGKAALSGVVGGVLGVTFGLAIGSLIAAGIDPADARFTEGVQAALLRSPGYLVTLVTTPLLAVALAMLSSWVAAVMAANEDAAVVLQGE